MSPEAEILDADDPDFGYDAVPTQRDEIMRRTEQLGVLHRLERSCDDQIHLCSASAAHPVPAGLPPVLA
jgi:hypothetical protein